ncbi:MAG: DUF6993 domain-containing protein [Microcella sp.]
MLRISAPRTAIARACVLAIAALVLAGCTPSSPADPPSTSAPLPPAAQPGDVTNEPSDPAEPAPEFVDGGSADDNAPFARFAVQQRVDALSDRPTSAQVSEALIDAGFARDALEVTADRTPLGLPTDVISFAVRVDDACIVGELRGSAVTTTVAPVLGTGRCLIGADASIG